MAMLIPSIDLMGGKIVQLVRGERKALEFDNVSEWVDRFRKFSLVQVIDLDAAKGEGNNQQLMERLCAELPCQVGGGLRTLDAAGEPLRWGAKKVIVGSSLFVKGGVNLAFAQDLSEQLGAERLVFAVDSRGGEVAIKGWRQSTGLQPAVAMRELEQFCTAFLYTSIDTEGMLQGFPFKILDHLRNATKRKLIVAGGISLWEEIVLLDHLGIDAVVGMAIYTGALSV
jgi:phosphoribosylformimino-5-aminoimidazole carboxamide ribotide isomerase